MRQETGDSSTISAKGFSITTNGKMVGNGFSGDTLRSCAHYEVFGAHSIVENRLETQKPVRSWRPHRFKKLT
jgi:hypothetical protein